MLVGATEKTVAATAVAGPSPTIREACNIAPMMVCGDPAAGAENNWGYEFGQPDVLKKGSAGNPEIGPGNFQLIRLGDNTGAADLRLAMAGKYDGCAVTGEPVETEPGNTVGPVAQGLNTRFGDYQGPMRGEQATYPPDVITQQPATELFYDDVSDTITEGNGGPVVSSAADLGYNYSDYNIALAAGVGSFDNAPPIGKYLRRVMALPIGDCSETTNGQGQVPVLGFGCYFLLQETRMGNDPEVFGQFIESCNSGGVPGAAPGDSPGLYIIQLYRDPDSPDS